MAVWSGQQHLKELYVPETEETGKEVLSGCEKLVVATCRHIQVTERKDE